jgi:hypothetical protein
MEARYALWRAEGRSEDLAEAHGLLTRIRDGAPADRRESLLRSVPIHREIDRAWNEASRAAS